MLKFGPRLTPCKEPGCETTIVQADMPGWPRMHRCAPCAAAKHHRGERGLQ